MAGRRLMGVRDVAVWQTFPWKRRVVQLGDSADTDRHGWPVTSQYPGSKAGEPLSTLRGLPLLMLRAEWGVGKSVVFAQEQDDLLGAGLLARACDLGKCGSDAGRAELKLSSAFTPPIDPVEWHVLLDGLDEGIENLPDLPDLIVEQLKALGEDARKLLRLRISCRTARWPSDFEDELQQLWADPRQRAAVTLVPLSADEVSVAARGAGVEDAGSFIAQVQAQGLVPLATHPMTLRQMLSDYQEGQSLPATAREAYEKACRRLCTETRRPPTAKGLRAQTSPEHLLAVAARVAAVLQFGARSVLSDADNHGGEVGDDAVALSRLATGWEPGHLGQDVLCTMAELRELTESSLFVPVAGSYRWEFAHKSYREFLAAEFLRAHDVRSATQRGLLWIGDGLSRHVIPDHQEVAAWRSSTDRGVFEDLVADDPLVALLCRDLPARSEADRASLAEAVIDQLRRDDTIRPEQTSLHRLDHDGLVDQLRPLLRSDPEESWSTYWAANIGRACRCPELTDDLLDLAESPAHAQEVRVAAIRAVTDPEPQSLTRLRQLAEDPSAEVVAAALQQLRPHRLSLVDFLSLFREPDPTYIGAAWSLRREVPGTIGPAEISEAAEWASGVLSSSAPGSRGLAMSLLSRAIGMAEPGEAREKLAKIVGDGLLGATEDTELMIGTNFRGPREELRTALGADEDFRRSLALHLAHRGTADQVFRLVSGFNGALADSRDLVYWMEHWDQLSTVEPQVAELLIRFVRPNDPEALERCEAARAAHPGLRKITAFWDLPPIERPWEQEQRAYAEAERQRNTYNETELETALDLALTSTRDNARGRWHNVVLQLLRTSDGDAPRVTGPLLTWAVEAPSRPQPGTLLAEQFQQAARHVLCTAPELRAQDLTPGGWSNSLQAAETMALPIVNSFGGLPNDSGRWAGWAVALASVSCHEKPALEEQRRLLPECVRRAGDALRPLLTAVLDTADAFAASSIVRSLAKVSDDALRKTLRDWAAQPHRTPEQWQMVVGELVCMGDTEAMTEVVGALTIDPGAVPHDSPDRKRWLLAVETLTRSKGLVAHWATVRCRLEDASVLDDVIQHVIRVTTMTEDWPAAVRGLSERDLADLYRLFVDHLGTEIAADQTLRSGFVGERDEKKEMVQSFPNILANRATLQSAAELRALSTEYPQVPHLRRQAQATARAAAVASVRPLPPEELLRLVAQAHLRIVRDERQLLDLVVEALEEMQEELQGYNGTAVNLWNRDRSQFGTGTKCWPAWEDDLCDAVAAFLRRSIGGQRVVINREVGIRRPGLPGHRTDIQIDVPACAETGQENLRVVIECKGCWNKELPTAAETQLVAYLTEPRTVGLLLAGYFDCSRWNDKKRGCPVDGHGLEEVRAHEVAASARVMAKTQATVSSFVLDCRLPGAESDWRKPDPSPS